MALTFYYSPQSNATRVHISLAELGIPYETVQLDLRAGDQRRPEFLALNPNGKVPTIVDDGTPMFESVAIQIHLGERYGVERGLWPAAGTPERMLALTWLVWGQVTLGATIYRYMLNTSQWVPAELHHAGQAEAAMKESLGLLGILDRHLAGRDYLTGSNYSLADADLASVLGWSLAVTRIDTAALPNLKAWLGRCTSRPAHKVESAH
ncbi:MAG: glutathione S-transferase family protein [Nannocystaceae bacterium]